MYIQNINISGGGDGQGFYVNSENVWIQNCYITGFITGIYLYYLGKNCHILDNSILDTIITDNQVYGINLDNSNFNTLTGNIVNNIGSTFIFSLSIMKMSLRYVITIPKAFQIEHVESNAQAADIKLSKNEISIIYKLKIPEAHNTHSKATKNILNTCSY